MANRFDPQPSISLAQADSRHTLSLSEHEKLAFLSDVHLGGFNASKNRRLEEECIALLNALEQRNIRLILLGDLFDYWMEYPGWQPSLGSRLLKAFETYHENNPSTLYIAGNHDCWTLGYFRDLGFDVEFEYRVLSTGSRNIMILHGDGLVDPRLELPRSLFNRLLRSKKFLAMFRRILPPNIGIFLMKYLSTVNKRLESEQSVNTRSRLVSWAEALMHRSRIDCVLSGHDHNMRLCSFDEGIYINPGFFGDTRTFALYTNGKIKLVRWNMDHEQFYPLRRYDPVIL